jgi:toxin ParE1/3/4
VAGASVVWSPQALADRDAHHAYVAVHAGPARAHRVLRRVATAISQLALFPESGRIVESGHRELVVPRVPYVVEYEVMGDTVHILRIWHSAQDRRSPGPMSDE